MQYLNKKLTNLIFSFPQHFIYNSLNENLINEIKNYVPNTINCVFDINDSWFNNDFYKILNENNWFIVINSFNKKQLTINNIYIKLNNKITNDKIINKMQNNNNLKKIFIVFNDINDGLLIINKKYNNSLTIKKLNNIKYIIYTIGHSTLPINEFIDILKQYGIQMVIDIRSIPGSNFNKQYNGEILNKSLNKNNISYTHLKLLGGLRKGTDLGLNDGWINKSFRSYADYMQTEEFKIGFKQLIKIASKKVVVIMCAESVPWRCHRSLVSDELLTNHFQVFDLIGKYNKRHELTTFAKIKLKDNFYNITYP